MKKAKKCTSLLITVIMLISMLCVMPMEANAINFNTSYTLTGDGHTDMYNIAMAQNERYGPDLGYGDDWCAAFVSHCAELAGQSAAIPYNAGAGALCTAVKNAGGYEVSSPITGDLIFFQNSGRICHAGIVVDSNRNISGNIHYMGQSPGKVCILKNSSTVLAGATWFYVRPNYSAQSPVEYASVENGVYYIKNVATGKYLAVDGGADVQAQNVSVADFTGGSEMKFELVAEDNGYAIRPLCSGSRMLNVYADNVANGKNVCIYDNTGHSSQRWLFEEAEGGYVIHSSNNKSCVLDTDGTNVLVKSGTGALWVLESQKEVENDTESVEPDTKPVVPEYEYAMFPMTHLNISQGVNGSFSHQGTNALDITGKDGGIDSAYAPFTGVVKRIYQGYVVWLESVEPVVYADGSVDYMTIMVMHDNDTSDLSVGQVVNQGERFFEEGTAGYATGNHIHLECGRGKFSGNGWYKNSDGQWMINGSMLPYDALHLSEDTVVINNYGYGWVYASEQKPNINYFSVENGEYYIKNVATGKYLAVDGGVDAQAQNVSVADFTGGNEMKFELVAEDNGYAIRPLCSGSRMLNVYADNVADGKNVCIYDNTGHSSQRWLFEETEGGYIIHSSNNRACVLDTDGTNVLVKSGTGALWVLETEEQPCDHYYYQAAVVESTCQEYGYVLYECECGDYYYEYSNEYGDHVPSDEWTMTRVPDETTNGIACRRCVICSAAYDYTFVDIDGNFTDKEFPENLPQEMAEITLKAELVDENYSDVLFSWNEVENADKYILELYTVGGFGEMDAEVTVKETTCVKSIPEFDKVHAKVSAYDAQSQLIGVSATIGLEMSTICADWWGQYGDSDCDGKISIKDATLIQKYIAGLEELDDFNLAAANVVSDEVVNIKDATAIQKFLAGLESKSIAGEECWYGDTFYDLFAEVVEEDY